MDSDEEQAEETRCKLGMKAASEQNPRIGLRSCACACGCDEIRSDNPNRPALVPRPKKLIPSLNADLAVTKDYRDQRAPGRAEIANWFKQVRTMQSPSNRGKIRKSTGTLIKQEAWKTERSTWQTHGTCKNHIREAIAQSW